MSRLAAERAGATLVELVVTLIVIGVVAALAPQLFSSAVRILVYLPRQVAVNQTAADITHQIAEGGFSTLPAGTVQGLRYAKNSASPTMPSIWLAEASRLGYRTDTGQSVLIRFDGTHVRRSLPAPACSPSATEEVLPYEAAGTVQITTSGAFFRYYNQSGSELFPGCTVGGTSSVRRVEIAFTAQTGTGNFDEGHAQEPMRTTVAIRTP